MSAGNRGLVPPPRSLGRSAFVARFGAVYEHGGWIAEGAWDAGLDAATDTVAGLHQAMTRIVDGAGEDARLALLRAHPELGARAVMTAASVAEQRSAGLDRLAAETQGRVAAGNARYRERFGFPFILAVRGMGPEEILTALERRLGNDRAAEATTALAEVHRIARLRLEAMAAADPDG